MKASWRTAWQGQEIVVFRDEAEVDRVPAERIRRIVLVHQGSGDSPGDVAYALVELDDDCLILSAETGFAGRVNFERQAFWAERACVFWVGASSAALPWKLRQARWLLRFTAPAFARVPKGDLLPSIERWPLQGPQTWEQRKWRRIERARMFAPREESQLPR